MARFDYQSALDVLKMVNNVNDLIDCASYSARGIDPQTGNPIQVQDRDQDGNPVGLPRAPTFDEIKTKFVQPAILGAERYIDLIEEFTKTGLYNADVGSILTALTVDPAGLRSEVVAMRTVIKNIKANAASIVDQAGLDQMANYIDANVPKIPLIRRKWNREQGA